MEGGCPPIHSTHLTGTVSELSFERPLSTTVKMADQRNFLAASLIFFIAHFAASFQSISLLFCSLLIQSKNKFTCPAMFLLFFSPRLAEIARHEPFPWLKAIPPSRVSQVGREGATGGRATQSSM